MLKQRIVLIVNIFTGAISMAVDEVNEKLLGPIGHSLDFVVAETYGQEEVSIRQVSFFKFWTLHENLNRYVYFLKKSKKYFSYDGRL